MHVMPSLLVPKYEIYIWICAGPELWTSIVSSVFLFNSSLNKLLNFQFCFIRARTGCCQKTFILEIPVLHVCWCCGEVRARDRPFLLLTNVSRLPTLIPSEWEDPCAGCEPLRLWWLDLASVGFMLYPESRL